MSYISIHNDHTPGVTMVSDVFLEHYMPRANGDFIKIYLYLLRLLGKPSAALSLNAIADNLYCTETDVFRALKYWEQEKVLSLTFRAQELESIHFLPLTAPPEAAYTAVTAEPAPEPAKAALSSAQSMTRSKLQMLQQKEEVRQLLFIASQYMGKTLTPLETEKILYFYEELHLPADLIEYLIDSCVSKNHPSIHYMEKIALSWAEKGITTVAQAKQNNSLYHRDYYTILKSLGISGREPVKDEITFMDTWMNEYAFSLEVITEACQRAAMQTFRPGMKYANAILKDWHERGVKHVSDIDQLPKPSANTEDTSGEERIGATAKTALAGKKTAKAKSKNPFNNFPQRNQDFSQLEKQLLNK